MLTLAGLTARRALIDESPDLAALRDHLIARAAPLLERPPPVPQVKALLSRDGGICPNDGTALLFDPWSPDAHRCPQCDGVFSGERHHAHWARAQHLWIAERAAHLATVHAMTGDAAAADRARDLLAAYYDLYFALPNVDNVLGPSHLFFSTYLESIWILDYLAAAFILREMEMLDEHDLARINTIADEAATLIADFNEGLSNRQTWNSAALTAIGAWFGDEDLAITAIESRAGLLGHLADGFGADGMWYEGENYHLFALRGLMVGLQWAGTAGADLLADDAIAAHLGDALMAPADTALPDLTFPARKDARFGVSLAHPAYTECWEAGLAVLGDRAPAALPAWLQALYAVPPRDESTYDAWLHDAGTPRPQRRGRTQLSWWSLLTMTASLADAPTPWAGKTRLMEQQGLAILRAGTTYLGLESGGGGGGHGHPDRLQLTLYAGGRYWLPDPGTGSYTTRDLFWYRSTLAHNAPLLDGESQATGDSARCTAFAVNGEWSWSAGAWNDLRRTVVLGPRWAIDIVHLDTGNARRLDLPWHINGESTVVTPGNWHPATDGNEFVDGVERFVPVDSSPGACVLVAATDGVADLRAWFAGDGEMLRANGPGLPGSTTRQSFYIRRTDRNSAFVVTVLDVSGGVTNVEFKGSIVEVREGDVSTTVQCTPAEATIVCGATRIVLGGVRPPPLPTASFVRDRPLVTHGQAFWIETAPALDGSLNGFNCTAPLLLDDEHHYYRSEAPYPGSDEFAAIAYANWSDNDLYLAVDVTKSGVVMRAADAPPLNLDNEPEDINADGIQVYRRAPDGAVRGWLVRPAAAGTVTVRPIGNGGDDALVGAWQPTPNGYRVTVGIPCPHLGSLRRAERLGFDLIVNEMQPGRIRRAGQLIWSGGPGWVYLRGDRHDPERFGELELVG
jgi:Heparinase II/III-like protein/Alginate lyase